MHDAARLLALNPGLGGQCALLVERLAGLRNADMLTAQADDNATRPAFAGPRWRDADGRLWQEIDLAALSNNEQFLGISA